MSRSQKASEIEPWWTKS